MTPARASVTAQLIAAALVAERLGGPHAGRVPPRAAELSLSLLRSTPTGRILAALSLSRAGRAILRKLERATVPGISAHWILRKAMIHGAAVQAVADGCGRVWVLGAGLDTIALRLRELGSGQDHAEFDHPATQRLKQISDEYARSGVHLHEADLATPDGVAALVRPPEPGVIIAEGLLMYLTEDRVRHLLRTLAASTAPPGRLIATIMHAPDARPAFSQQTLLARAALRVFGEPMRWAVPLPDVRAFFAACGWRTLGIFHPSSPASRPGEAIIVADRV